MHRAVPWYVGHDMDNTVVAKADEVLLISNQNGTLYLHMTSIFQDFLTSEL